MKQSSGGTGRARRGDLKGLRRACALLARRTTVVHSNSLDGRQIVAAEATHSGQDDLDRPPRHREQHQRGGRPPRSHQIQAGGEARGAGEAKPAPCQHAEPAHWTRGTDPPQQRRSPPATATSESRRAEGAPRRSHGTGTRRGLAEMGGEEEVGLTEAEEGRARDILPPPRNWISRLE